VFSSSLALSTKLSPPSADVWISSMSFMSSISCRRSEASRGLARTRVLAKSCFVLKTPKGGSELDLRRRESKRAKRKRQAGRLGAQKNSPQHVLHVSCNVQRCSLAWPPFHSP
jgi:hypothetical protein